MRNKREKWADRVKMGKRERGRYTSRYIKRRKRRESTGEKKIIMNRQIYRHKQVGTQTDTYTDRQAARQKDKQTDKYGNI